MHMPAHQSWSATHAQSFCTQTSPPAILAHFGLAAAVSMRGSGGSSRASSGSRQCRGARAVAGGKGSLPGSCTAAGQGQRRTGSQHSCSSAQHKQRRGVPCDNMSGQPLRSRQAYCCNVVRCLFTYSTDLLNGIEAHRCNSTMLRIVAGRAADPRRPMRDRSRRCGRGVNRHRCRGPRRVDGPCALAHSGAAQGANGVCRLLNTVKTGSLSAAEEARLWRLAAGSRLSPVSICGAGRRHPSCKATRFFALSHA